MNADIALIQVALNFVAEYDRRASPRIPVDVAAEALRDAAEKLTDACPEPVATLLRAAREAAAYLESQGLWDVKIELGTADADEDVGAHDFCDELTESVAEVTASFHGRVYLRYRVDVDGGVVLETGRRYPVNGRGEGDTFPRLGPIDVEDVATHLADLEKSYGYFS